MTRKKRNNMGWIKEQLELSGENWRDNWEQYVNRLKKFVKEQFGDQWEEVWKTRIETTLNHVILLFLKIYRTEEWKKTLNEEERSKIKGKQDIIYRDLLEEIKDRKWVEKVTEKNFDNEHKPQNVSGITSHSRTESQSSSAKKVRPANLDLKNINQIPVEINSGERSKTIGVSPQQTKKGEKEIDIQDQDKKNSNQILLSDLLEKQLKLENKIRELEKENMQLRLEKQIGELAGQIVENKKLIKENHFKLYRELMEERIAENDDIHAKHYLEENQELKLKITKLEKQKSELENQLAFLQKEETVTKIEILPKKV